MTVLWILLVTAMFLNLSAAALASTVEMPRLKLSDPGVFRVVQRAGAAGEIVPHVVIGGIASASVIVITAMGPLVGFLYIKRSVAVWKCSLLAVCVIAVCVVGLDVLPYLNDVHPKVLNVVQAESNPVLAFAMAVGWTGHLALRIPIVWGALAGMILLEGVTGLGGSRRRKAPAR